MIIYGVLRSSIFFLTSCCPVFFLTAARFEVLSSCCSLRLESLRAGLCGLLSLFLELDYFLLSAFEQT